MRKQISLFLLAAFHAITVAQGGEVGYKLTRAQDSFLIYADRGPILFDLKKYYKSSNPEFVESNGKSDCYYVSSMPLSIFGNHISILETTRFDPTPFCNGNGGGSVRTKIIKIRDRGAGQVTLTDFFTEITVLNALKADKFVQRNARDAKALSRVSNFKDFLEHMQPYNEKNCQSVFSDNLMSNFSFYNQVGKSIYIRLWLDYSCGGIPGDQIYEQGNVQIGIILPRSKTITDLITKKQFFTSQNIKSMNLFRFFDFSFTLKR
jgi:hypothetical protein